MFQEHLQLVRCLAGIIRIIISVRKFQTWFSGDFTEEENADIITRTVQKGL